MNLDYEQLSFLENELNITKEYIEKMSSAEWNNVREQCFYIEADELMDLETDEAEESDRCSIATSIADIKFSDLKSNR